MRSIIATFAAIVLVCATAGGAAGAGAFKETDHVRDIGCDGVATPDGLASFYASDSELYGMDGFVDVWAGEPFESELVWWRDEARPVTAIFGPTSADVTIPLRPSGEAHIVANLDAAEEFSFMERHDEGNSHGRFAVAGTAFAATGTLTLPGGDPVPFGPAECGASDAQVSSWSNAPHSAVRGWTSTGGFCQLTNSDGDTADVFLDLFDENLLRLDAYVVDEGGDDLGASGVGEIVVGTVAMTLDEYDPETGEPTGGSGSASVALSESADDVDYVLRASKLVFRVKGSLVDVSGTVATSLGSFNLDPCLMAATRNKEIVAPSNGPKPSGKRPVNDLPGGAIALRIGAKASTTTRGAQVPSEVGYPCMVVEDFDGTIITIPVEHTVWYKVAGTGQSVTVDTAGSDFDTVIAVYEGSADESATVACVDDSEVQPFGRTLQGAATFPTVAGVTYWVQIGGFQENIFGPDPNVPYGNLRVAVR